MNIENKAKRIWVGVSIISLSFPVLLLFDGQQTIDYTWVMSILIGAMTIATLPTSLFVMPFMAVFLFILEIQPVSPFPAYLYLGILTLVGYVQWFRLAPAYFGTIKPLALPTIYQK